MRTPQEILDSRRERWVAQAELLEAAIERALEERFIGDPVHIPYPKEGMPTGLTEIQAVNRLASNYLAKQGWQMEWHDDQRDGPYVVVTPVKKTT